MQFSVLAPKSSKLSLVSHREQSLVPTLPPRLAPSNLGQCSFSPPLIHCKVATVPVETSSGQVRVPATLEDALDLSKAFNKAFSTSLYEEHAYEITQITGSIPKGLRGTLLRNGPGLFEVGGKSVPQPFDGDGMVCSITFDGEGRAFFRNKFVRTPGFIAERRSGKQLFRSAFNRGLPDAGDSVYEIKLPFMQAPLLRFANPVDIQIKDTANTNVLYWGGKILALYERGMPHKLSAALETEGPDNLNNTVDGKYMGAHLRMTQESDGSERLVMFSHLEAGMDAAMTFYEYSQDFKLLHRSRHTIPGGAFGFYHDLAVSENFYILYENPISPDFMGLLTKVPLGQAAITECLNFDPTRPVKMHLIPRPGRGLKDTAVRTYEIPGSSFFTFHFVNAYQINKDGSTPVPFSGSTGQYLVVDSGSSGTVDFANNVETVGGNYYGDTNCRVQYTRTVVDLTAPVGSSTAVVRQTILEKAMEFGFVAPGKAGQPHHTSYMIASPLVGGSFFGPLQGICKMEVDPLNGVGQTVSSHQVTTQFWQAPGASFPSEPAFAPRNPDCSEGGRGSSSSSSAEDDGWIMSVVFDSETTKSSIVILDAKDLGKGPVATLHLKHHVPQGLHGMFTPEFLGPPSDMWQAQTPYDIRRGV